MPAFFEAEFWSLANPEFWVGVGLLRGRRGEGVG